MPTIRRTRARFRLNPTRLLIAAAIVALAFWIGARSLGVAVAEVDLRSAVALNSSDPSITGARSRELFDGGDRDVAVRMALAALRQDATVLPAIQTIGLDWQVSGRSGEALRVLAYAQRLSRRDLQTHLWAIETLVARDDVAGVLREYDFALRTSLNARPILFPVLGQAIDDPKIAQGLAARLRAKPLWSDAFFEFLTTDAQVPPAGAARFLATVQRLGIEPPKTGTAALVFRSLGRDDVRSAWAAYRVHRPGADPSEVRDPDFAGIPDPPSLFDWTFANEGSIFAQVNSDAATRGLEVEVGAGAVGMAAQQLQRLAPGRYRLAVRAEPVPGDARLSWNMSCRDGAQLVKLVPGRGDERQPSSALFDIPATSCELQMLQLIADASDSSVGLRHVTKTVEILRVR